MSILEFEKPIIELEEKIRELETVGSDKNISIEPEIKKLQAKLEKMKSEIYGNLTSWQRVLIARHPQRPYTMDYVNMMMTDFIEIHGDRMFSDDLALIAGIATLGNIKVAVMGHQKGRDTNESVKRNFGCAHPEGYRKAMRVMEMAEKFGLPIVIFIDTPGAYPGIGAEERGQAQAIASNLKDMALIKTPIVATVIGEGGSGGALGIGIADKVCMLQHSYYSVISPEGCASILWRSSTKAPEAAEALKITSEHLVRFGVVEEVIPEPMIGAHGDPQEVAANLKKTLISSIKELSKLSPDELLDHRYNKFRTVGEYIDQQKEQLDKK